MNEVKYENQFDQDVELTKPDILSESLNEDSDRQFFSPANAEKIIVREQNNQKVEDLKLILNAEPVYIDSIKQYLHNYLGLKEAELETLVFVKAKELSNRYLSQLDFFQDKRLENVIIAIIPDAFWFKGVQPSESTAERQLIIIKQSYFESLENPDEIAWLCHEFAHCQSCLDSESLEDYKLKMKQFAFEDLKSKYKYPNNQVEEFTFTRQFQYLKDNGKTRKKIIELLKEYYPKKDFAFFNRLLDRVYGS